MLFLPGQTDLLILLNHYDHILQLHIPTEASARVARFRATGYAVAYLCIHSTKHYEQKMIEYEVSMYNNSKLKIMVESNRPSDLALRQFQIKLFQLQRANEANLAVKADAIAKGENQ